MKNRITTGVAIAFVTLALLGTTSVAPSLTITRPVACAACVRHPQPGPRA